MYVNPERRKTWRTGFIIHEALGDLPPLLSRGRDRSERNSSETEKPLWLLLKAIIEFIKVIKHILGLDMDDLATLTRLRDYHVTIAILERHELIHNRRA